MRSSLFIILPQDTTSNFLYLVLQVIHSTARLVLSVVVQDSIGVSPAEGSLYLQRAKCKGLVNQLQHIQPLCKTKQKIAR